MRDFYKRYNNDVVKENVSTNYEIVWRSSRISSTNIKPWERLDRVKPEWPNHLLTRSTFQTRLSASPCHFVEQFARYINSSTQCVFVLQYLQFSILGNAVCPYIISSTQRVFVLQYV